MALLTRIGVTVDAENEDMLSAFLAINVAHGWEETPLAHGGVLCTVHMTHKAAAGELTQQLRARFPDARLDVVLVEEEDWVEAWKEFFTPVKGGEHFYVLAPWMQQELASTQRIPIFIEPKTAFGTGHHGTTSLCLDTVSSLYSTGKIKKGDSFLDLGTGSGILGIAAAKLGLLGEGVDIDLVAIENALENRALNGVSPEQFILKRGGVEVASKKYQLILANILAGTLMDMAPDIFSLLAPGGWLVLSGILEIQADAVEVVYTDLGLPAPQRRIRGEWASLEFVKG